MDSGWQGTDNAVRALNIVDLPEFGNPIIPQEKLTIQLRSSS